jgi:hypothetical protein
MTISKLSATVSLCLCLVFTCLALTAIGAQAETTPTFVAIEKPASGTVVMSLKPKVSLSLLTAAGTKDPKVEWSDNAATYLNEAVDTALKAKSYGITRADSDQITAPEAVQVLKLNQAVNDSITLNRLPAYKLPTKAKFEWTLGEGATRLIPEAADGMAKARYALFLTAEGSYSSGGRAALAVGAAIFGAAVPLGGQYVQASLVDLNTGQVVWYEFTVVGAGTDIRTQEGATTLVTTLFKKFPL